MVRSSFFSKPAKTSEVEAILANKILENSLLITDSCAAYRKFAENHNIKLKQIPSNKHNLGKYMCDSHNTINRIIRSIIHICCRSIIPIINFTIVQLLL